MMSILFVLLCDSVLEETWTNYCSPLVNNHQCSTLKNNALYRVTYKSKNDSNTSSSAKAYSDMNNSSCKMDTWSTLHRQQIAQMFGECHFQVVQLLQISSQKLVESMFLWGSSSDLYFFQVAYPTGLLPHLCSFERVYQESLLLIYTWEGMGLVNPFSFREFLSPLHCLLWELNELPCRTHCFALDSKGINFRTSCALLRLPTIWKILSVRNCYTTVMIVLLLSG